MGGDRLTRFTAQAPACWQQFRAHERLVLKKPPCAARTLSNRAPRHNSLALAGVVLRGAIGRGFAWLTRCSPLGGPRQSTIGFRATLQICRFDRPAAKKPVLS